MYHKKKLLLNGLNEVPLRLTAGLATSATPMLLKLPVAPFAIGFAGVIGVDTVFTGVDTVRTGVGIVLTVGVYEREGL